MEYIIPAVFSNVVEKAIRKHFDRVKRQEMSKP